VLPEQADFALPRRVPARGPRDPAHGNAGQPSYPWARGGGSLLMGGALALAGAPPSIGTT
jgi:hypothetical protein